MYGGEHYGGAPSTPGFGDGGGFMPSQNAAPDSGAKGNAGNKGYNENQTMRTVTIKSLVDADKPNSYDSLDFDGKPLKDVVILGLLKRMTDTGTDQVLEVDDGTGVVTATLEQQTWQDEDEDKRALVQPNTYVRVFGGLRIMDGTKLIAYSVQPVRDFNEVTHHYTQAIYEHLKLTRMQRVGPTSAAAHGGAGPSHAAPAAGGGAYQAFGGEKPLGPCEQAVMEYLNQQQARDGTPIPEIVGVLQPRFPAPAIQQALAALGEQGQYYTTIDENHIKSVQT